MESVDVDYFGEMITIYVSSEDWYDDDCVVDPETGVMYIRSSEDDMFYPEGTDRISEEAAANALGLEAIEVDYFGETKTIHVASIDWCDDNCVVDPETGVMYILCDDGVWRVEGIDYGLDGLE